MKSVLFVCLGNICRSPAGEGILTAFAKEQGFSSELHIESCGIGAWHIGEFPDSRMRQAAEVRGYSLLSRAQQFDLFFFEKFDYIMASDQNILQELTLLARSEEDKKKLYLMTAFSSNYSQDDIPDPYYGGKDGFERVIDMLEECCQGLIAHLFGVRS
jgi:protein-tyrosine phosphatase